MNKAIYYLFLIGAIGIFPNQLLAQSNFDTTYTRWVGDIETDSTVDCPDFYLCNGKQYAAQYFHYTDDYPYMFGKDSLMNIFQHRYKPYFKEDQSGYIRIRFIINCEGQSGKFRISQAGRDYLPKTFHKRIISQLMEIIKSVNGWRIMFDHQDRKRDYYMYLTFKLKNGEITDIIP